MPKKKGGKAGKAGKGGKGQAIDEYQLRRDKRDQSKKQKTGEKEEMEGASGEAKDLLIGGIEGGGTRSTLVILNSQGVKLTQLEGPSTNHWMLGIEETVARLGSMIEKGKETLGISKSVPLACTGLALSGCSESSTNQLLVDSLREKYPEASKDYVVCSDTLGSLRSGLESCGIVLIAGTGSNAMLVNPDGTTHNCGGWGHMMGDEGSGFWIAHRACKYVFDALDDFVRPPEPICYVWPAIRNHFEVPDREAMLPHLYTNFDKSEFASFAEKIAAGCQGGDPLCLRLFQEAGKLLARHIISLSSKAHNDLKLASGGLNVICIGSVWKSWRFLQKGFAQEIQDAGYPDELSLLRLTTTCALGASYLAAEKIDLAFYKPYSENVKLFFHYKRISDKERK